MHVYIRKVGTQAYISDTAPGSTKYLHSDGNWRISTYNETTKQYTGWYKSCHEAVKLVESLGGMTYTIERPSSGR